MPVAETNASFDALQRRHPRILRAIAWLRMHPVLCSVAGSIGIAAVFLADVMHPEYLVDGLYAVPLLFLALAVHWRAVAFAVAVAVALSALVFFWEGPIDADRWLLLLYFAAVGAALVMVSYLIRRLTTATEHAVLRPALRGRRRRPRRRRLRRRPRPAARLRARPSRRAARGRRRRPAAARG